MAILNPYLCFEGNAREAMETYREIFGGKLDINTFGEFGAPEHEGQPAPADGIMHAQLATDDGFTLMASDVPPGMDPWGNGAISLSGDEKDALTRYFEALSEGGQVQMPLERQMWGDVYGQCVDRFGVTWMVNISDPATE